MVLLLLLYGYSTCGNNNIPPCFPAQRLAVADDDDTNSRQYNMATTVGIAKTGQLQQTSLCTAKLCNH